MSAHYTVTLQLRVIDEALFQETVEFLDIEGYAASDMSRAERIELCVTDQDVIALKRGKAQGWNDFGLERVN